MSNKIPTAEEVLLSTLNDMHEGNLADYLKDNPEELKIYSEPILNWGRNLVEAALKAASKQAVLTDFASEFLQEGALDAINKESILNAYPKENIK